MPRTLLFSSIAVAASVLIFGASIANAQYPNPQGSLTLTSDQTVSGASAGMSVPLICEVRDTTGAPMGGETCTFTIVNEPGGPGGDAAVGSKVVTRVTDAFGQARTQLYTGSTPGVIIVSANSGVLSSTIVVDVAGTVETQGATGTGASGLPPAAPLEITPPSTGDGGLLGQ